MQNQSLLPSHAFYWSQTMQNLYGCHKHTMTTHFAKMISFCVNQSLLPSQGLLEANNAESVWMPQTPDDHTFTSEINNNFWYYSHENCGCHKTTIKQTQHPPLQRQFRILLFVIQLFVGRAMNRTMPF
eukprot:822794_1